MGKECSGWRIWLVMVVAFASPCGMNHRHRCYLSGLALLLLGLTTASVSVPVLAQDMDGWTTVLATPEDLKGYAENQATLEEGMLHVRNGNGILVPQARADGAIRARFHFRERTGFPQLRLRRSGNSQAKNADYYEVILWVRPGQTTIKEGFVNVTVAGKGKRLGVVPLPEPLVLGASVDMELAMVGEHLEVKVNGKVAFEVNDNAVAKGGYWGVAALDGWFSNIQVRAARPKSTDPRIIQLEEGLAAAVQREVVPVHQEAVRSLDAKYLAALDRALHEATQNSNLDRALALREEKKRVEEQQPLPPADNTPHEALNALRQTYRTSLAQLDTTRDQGFQALREKFLQGLAAYEDELTREQKLDAALEVRKRREFEATQTKR